MSITEEELEQIREEQVKFMDKKLFIQRELKLEADESGYYTINRGLDGNGVPGSIKAGFFGISRTIADRLQTSAPYTVLLPYGTDLQTGDWVFDEDPDDKSTKSSRTKFIIRYVGDEESFETAIRAIADRHSP